MKPTILKLTLLVAALSALGSGLAFPGAADLSTGDGSTMKFEYRGDKLRINMEDDQGYMIADETGLYVVRDADGQLMVIDAGKMMQMFGSMAGSASPSVAANKVVSLKPTGRKEDHAGIRGEIYDLEYTEEGSTTVQRAELVLSSDERLLELSHAMSGMARTIAKSAGKSLEGANEFEQRLNKLNMGVLRYGDDMTVSAISDTKIDNKRFVLPAEPTDLSGLSGLADFVNNGEKAGQAEPAESKKSSGMVSGFLSAFGKKTDRQEQRVEDKADQKADEATDDAVDGAIDSALDKLFGK